MTTLDPYLYIPVSHTEPQHTSGLHPKMCAKSRMPLPALTERVPTDSNAITCAYIEPPGPNNTRCCEPHYDGHTAATVVSLAPLRGMTGVCTPTCTC